MKNTSTHNHWPPHHGGPADSIADIEVDAVKPGMRVEASAGDLGEHDVSHARITGVLRNARGSVTSVIVEKGLIFRKWLTVPAGRVTAVSRAPGDAATVTIDASEQEIDALRATGSERLAEDAATAAPTAGSGHWQRGGADNAGILREVEEELPTADGLLRLELSARQRMREQPAGVDGAALRADTPAVPATPTAGRATFSLRSLGPGFLSGMAGNDASAVTSYSVNGATNGYGQLWLLLLATPLYQAVQYACAKVGRVTQQGFAEILREHYGQRVAIPLSLILITANTALIAADLVAIGTGFQLLTGLAWEWFVVPVAVALWYLTVYQNFGVIKRIFLVLSLAFVAYLITGAFSGAHWNMVLRATVVPHLGFDLASISSAVALLGATVSPYTMYWQVQGEKEEVRAGKTPQQKFTLAALDIAAGTISGNLVAYAIIVCTSATLFSTHRQIATAADAARALQPLLGPYAADLFALGFIGAGLVAIPVLLASTSYAVSGTFGWSASLWKKPWQSEGFYLILSGTLVLSLVVGLLGFDPIQLMFWANVLQGVLSPILVIFVLLVGNNRQVMRSYRLGWLTNLGLGMSAAVMFAATCLLFYGLLRGGH